MEEGVGGQVRAGHRVRLRTPCETEALTEAVLRPQFSIRSCALCRGCASGLWWQSP